MRISYFILKQPSDNAPNRKRSLQTFSNKQVNKKRVSQLEKDKKLLMSAMKNKIHFAQKSGKPVEKTDEQLLLYPLSISDMKGILLQDKRQVCSRTGTNHFPPPKSSHHTCHQIGCPSAPLLRECSDQLIALT